jgi:hypothetical protein
MTWRARAAAGSGVTDGWVSARKGTVWDGEALRGTTDDSHVGRTEGEENGTDGISQKRRDGRGDAIAMGRDASGRGMVAVVRDC